MINNPKISVVMTVFNGEKYLREAIESILNQTFTDFEFIIVNDASSDATEDIIASFLDDRIVSLKNEKNFGQTKSLNIGIRASRGTYIARMDADDVSLPERLELQRDFLDAHPTAAVVGTWRLDMNESGQPLSVFKVPVDPLEIKCFMAACGDLSFWCITHPSVLIRRSVFKEVGLYDEMNGQGSGFPQDYELWSRILPKHQFANIGRVLLQYRILERSDSRLDNRRQIDARQEVSLKKIQTYLPAVQSQETKIILRMLEYQPQQSAADCKQVFRLFDEYIKAYMGSDYSSPIVRRTIERMKLFYVPVLFKTTKCFSMISALKIFLKYPGLVFDSKFYRKILKVYFFNNPKFQNSLGALSLG